MHDLLDGNQFFCAELMSVSFSLELHLQRKLLPLALNWRTVDTPTVGSRQLWTGTGRVPSQVSQQQGLRRHRI
jgi:hypothetical protein